MKRLLRIGVLLWGAATALIAQADAMPVIDFAALLKLQTEIEALQSQLKQLSGGQYYNWNETVATVNQLGGIISKTNGIAYTAQNLDGAFKALYPGYQAPNNYRQQYQNIINTTQNTLNGSLQSIGGNAADFQEESKRLAFIKAQVQSAQGETQVVQAASQISAEQVAQLQLLRQTVMAQTNAQAAYYAAQLQQEASARAELAQVIDAGNTHVPAYGTSGNSLSPPNF